MKNWFGYTQPFSKMIDRHVDAEDSWAANVLKEN